MNKQNKIFKGVYCIDGMEVPNLVTSIFEKEILNRSFKGTGSITGVTVKCGQISEAFSRETVITDIIEASNYTPVTLSLPSSTDWYILTDETLAYSIKTKELTFEVSGGECNFNCFYMVDQDGNLLSVSGKLSEVASKSVDFSGYYKLYCL